MKTNFSLRSFTCLTILLFTLNSIKSQVPQGINYQAVLRNATGSIVQNQNVSIKLSIHQATPDGTVVYEETHASLQTNGYGLVNLQIGKGVASAGIFSSIPWSTSSFFLQVQSNIGSGFVNLGTTQFLTVPYSMVADTVKHGDKWGSQVVAANPSITGNGTTSNPLGIAQQYATNGQTLKWNGTSWLPANDNDSQSLSVTGTELKITNGNSVLLPSSAGWNLTGNSGTNPSNNFIGTTDSQSLEFRTNNLLKTRITTKGQIEVHNTGSSVFIGKGAGGNDDLNNRRNVFVGDSVGVANTTGYINTAVGNFALHSNTIGSLNTAFGNEALTNNTIGNNNTAIGNQSLNYNTIGGYNTANGDNALYSNTTGFFNVAIGYKSLYSNNESNNTAIGTYALHDNTTGSANTSLGNYALSHNISGSENTALGNNALGINSSGYFNVAIGSFALGANSIGKSNTACGYTALDSNTTGSFNTALGFNAFSNATGFSNSMALGSMAYEITADNMVRIGNSSITSIGGKVGWTIISDARVKTNIQENVSGLAFIKGLRPVTYNYDSHKEGEITGAKETPEWNGKEAIDEMPFSGFLAQDVEQAAIKAGYNFGGVDKPKNKYGLWGLRYEEFTVPLVKAVQEQQIMIEEMKKQITVLQDQISKLLKNQ